MRLWNPIPRSPGNTPGGQAFASSIPPHPTRDVLSGRQPGIRGFTLVEFCVVVGCIVLLAAIGVGRLWQTKRSATRNPLQCQQNLKQIGMALNDFQLDHNGRYPWQVPMAEGGSLEAVPGGQSTPHFRTLTNTIRNARVFLCPMDPVRHRGATLATLDDAAISYFVNVSASPGYRHQILAGDRTISPTDDVTTGPIEVGRNSPLQWAYPAPDEPGHVTGENRERTGNLLFNNGSLMEATVPQLQRVLKSMGSTPQQFILP